MTVTVPAVGATIGVSAKILIKREKGVISKGHTHTFNNCYLFPMSGWVFGHNNCYCFDKHSLLRKWSHWHILTIVIAFECLGRFLVTNIIIAWQVQQNDCYILEETKGPQGTVMIVIVTSDNWFQLWSSLQKWFELWSFYCSFSTYDNDCSVGFM